MVLNSLCVEMDTRYGLLREAGLIRTRNEGVTRMNALRRDDIEQRFPGLLACVLSAPKD